MARIAELLGKPLFPWQRYVCDVALEVLEDGSWAYEEVVVLVQRRAGKTVLIEPVTLHRCSQPVKAGAWLTAQKRENAVKRWRDVTDTLLASSFAPKLHRKVSHSFEALRWRETGAGFFPFAPDEETMHGEDPDLVWVDELWSHGLVQKNQIEAGYEAAWSVKSGQAWKMSAAGTARSSWLKHERARGRAAVEAGDRSGIAFFEWCVPEVVAGRTVDELEADELLEVVLANHPRRDHGLRVDYLRTQLEKGRPDFLRAYGGIDLDDSGRDLVIPRAALKRSKSVEKIPADARVGLGVAVDPESRSASVSAAWRDPISGVALTELIEERPGTRWLAGFVDGLDERHDVGATAVNNVGSARDTADRLEQPADEGGYGLDLLRLSSSDYAAAVTRFNDGIVQVDGSDPSVSWNGDPEFLKAVEAAHRDRRAGSGLVWGSSGDPIVVLESHTLAVWAADHTPAVEQPARPFRIF